MNVEQSFRNVMGREMSHDELTRYLKFQKEFEIPDSDPTWIMFIYFEFYQRIFEQFPGNARKEAEEVAQSLRAASVKVTEATRDEVKAARDKAKIEIEKMQEDVKVKVAAALGKALETEIREAVNQLKGQSNRPLHKKWLIAMGVVIVVALGLGGWGFWNFSEYEEKVGEAKISAVLDAGEDFSHFMKCDKPGWEKQWVNNTEGKKLLVCYPYPDSKGNTSGWMITP